MSQISMIEENAGTIIKLKGQFIGGEETDELRKMLQSVAEQKKNKLIVDLAEVTYLNSTALGVLISAHANFVKRDGKIVICEVSETLYKIFVITKLTNVFNMAPTLEEAKKFL
ncbi:MAG: STAS domain-containing protein [Chloroflexota bacterium]